MSHPNVDQIPTTTHHALVMVESITIPGDERSRTNPGHGYPRHTQSYFQYEFFETQAGMLERAKYLKLSYPHMKFIALIVTPVDLEFGVKVVE